MINLQRKILMYKDMAMLYSEILTILINMNSIVNLRGPRNINTFILNTI